MKTHYLFLMSTLLVFTACFSPKPVIRMEAADEHYYEWNYGRQLVFTDKEDLTAKVMFDKYTRKHLIFDIEIINNGNEKVVVNPEEWWLEPVPAPTKTQRFALDPEKEILNLELNDSREEAYAKNAAAIAGVAAVAATVAIAAKGSSANTTQDVSGNTIVYLDPNVYIPVVPGVAPSYIPPTEKEFWETLALRKTTVPPGYKVGGKVVFPRYDRAPTLKLHLPVAGKELLVTLRQRLIKP